MTEIPSTFREVGGLVIHALEGGTGSPVVLLHSQPGDSSMFAATGSMLANHHHVLAPDLRGHGKSAKPRGDYSIPTQASHVLAYLDAVGVERFTAVGNSYGGRIAPYLAAPAPAPGTGLALPPTSPHPPYRPPRDWPPP